MTTPARPGRPQAPAGQPVRQPSGEANDRLQLTVTPDGRHALIGDTPVPVRADEDPRNALARELRGMARAAGRTLHADLAGATGQRSYLMTTPDGRVLEAAPQPAGPAAAASELTAARSVEAWPHLYLFVTADNRVFLECTALGRLDRRAIAVPEGIRPEHAAVAAAARYITTDLNLNPPRPVRATATDADGTRRRMVIRPDGTSEQIGDPVPPAGGRPSPWRRASRTAQTRRNMPLRAPGPAIQPER